jgi:hypothetical protein
MGAETRLGSPQTNFPRIHSQEPAMVYPGIPREPNEPSRNPPQDRETDEDLDISNIRRPPSDDLTTGDWLLCIFCSGIACIIGIIRLIQGKPGAGKMVAVALMFSMMWSIINVLLRSMN